MKSKGRGLGSAISLVVLLLAGCGGGVDGGAPILVSGVVTFDSVPTSISSGLVYTSTTQKPARAIVIEAINTADLSVATSTVTDASGQYVLILPRNANVKVRAKAQMKKAGVFDFQVVDNTSSKALYVMDSVTFNTGSSNLTKNLNAASGWGGTGYTATRAAAPFAVLDTVFKCVSKVTAADPAATFVPLQINWSVNNIGTPGSLALGQISNAHYSSTENAIYIRGAANNDTDEYDDHVIAHEWGHYFEANFSRSDSIGGSHGYGDKLDPRVAFGEGFGDAFSGIATDDKDYIDTYGYHQGGTSVHLDLADGNGDLESIGWFSEDSVWYVLYSLYKNIGFTPIYNVLVNDQKTANSFTSIYSFSAFLKSRYPTYATPLNSLLASKNISANAIDQWDSSKTETNNGLVAASLPIYVRLISGVPTTVYVGDQDGWPNKLLNRRFFVFTIPAGPTTAHTLAVDRDVTSQPTLRLYAYGTRLVSRYATYIDTSTITFPLGTLSAGIYYGEIFENSATGTIPFTMTLN